MARSHVHFSTLEGAAAETTVSATGTLEAASGLPASRADGGVLGSWARTTIVLDAAVIVYARLRDGGAAQVDGSLNSGVALIPNALYTFDVWIPPSWTLDLVTSGAASFLCLSIDYTWAP